MRFSLDIEPVKKRLLQQEDTDGDKKITIEDTGPKSFDIVNEKGELYTIKGTYHLSNLLQELTWQERLGKNKAIISLENIEEPPLERINRMIREYYWKGMTRTLDTDGIYKMAKDDKTDAAHSLPKIRIYVPYSDIKGYHFYKNLAVDGVAIEVERLPKEVTPEFVQTIDHKPGVLSLATHESNGEILGVPFAVPGGRFNEMYGWDSYFQNIGMLLDGKFSLVKGVITNFQYEIEHYGKILNANRSYYLTRTQPPFFTSMIREYTEALSNVDLDVEEIRSWILTALKEYFTVWEVVGKRKLSNGLNRYLAEGIGITPEAEEGHYDSILKPFADKYNLGIKEFEQQYAQRKLQIPELDEYFVHDRTVRESGHDTTYRFEGICANLCPVELNCMLLKYEQDFEFFIEEYFPEGIPYNDKNFTKDFWVKQQQVRTQAMRKYMWDAADGMFFDYNHVTEEKTRFLSATCFFPLWVGLPTVSESEQMIQRLKELVVKGGVVATSLESRGELSEGRPERQWDYPNGWAPHQMILWKGLQRYGYADLQQDLVKRWLHMIAKNAVDYNGTIPEKFDVIEATHKVFAEYGNVGTQFDYITEEGFGWMNASFQFGYNLLNSTAKQKLNKALLNDNSSK